jgi:large subunit ribosomal protein L30
MSAAQEKRGQLRLELTKSPIGSPKRQKATLKALGFHHLNEVITVEDSAAVRGMVAKVQHLVRMEEVQ